MSSCARMEAILALTTEPQSIEPRAILAGGGVENMHEGLIKTAYLYTKQIQEYLQRLKVAGLDRTERIAIPIELPMD